jgi:alpha-galactosidase
VIYAEGWQSWSPSAGVFRDWHEQPRASDERAQTMGWRPGTPAPDGVVQGEGLLVVDGHAWFAPEPAREVPTIRVAADGRITADGEAAELDAESLDAALAAVAECWRVPELRTIPSGWCSWSYYFSHVTERDVLENLDAIDRLELPIEIVQIDDGYTEPLDRIARRILDAGKTPGIWTAPFIAYEGKHEAGFNWNRRLFAREPDLRRYRELAAWGFRYFKLDFLYAGALRGIAHYRDGLEAIREAVGADAILLGCGAPLLPSIGLVDAMRVGPDVLPEPPSTAQDLAHVIRQTNVRRWMNGKLWVNDPDTLVARPEIAEREAWAAHLEGYGGLTFSSDRLDALDERGLELTRRVLA